MDTARANLVTGRVPDAAMRKVLKAYPALMSVLRDTAPVTDLLSLYIYALTGETNREAVLQFKLAELRYSQQPVIDFLENNYAHKTRNVEKGERAHTGHGMYFPHEPALLNQSFFFIDSVYVQKWCGGNTLATHVLENFYTADGSITYKE